METTMHLGNGMVFDLGNSNLDAKSFADSLNDNRIQMITVNNVSINKAAIAYVRPKVTPDNANTRIFLNDGLNTIIDVFVENFNADELSTRMNNMNLNSVDIGQAVLNKHMIMMVMPIEPSTPQPTA